MIRQRRPKGEGSVYKRKRDGKWVAEHLQGYKPDGKKDLVRFVADTQREVLDWLAERRAEKQRGLLAPPGQQTVGQFLEAWLRDTITPTLAPRTAVTYQHVIEKHVLPTLGRVKLNQLTHQRLQQLYRQKAEEGLTRTTEMIHAVLHSAFSTLPHNPADKARAIRSRPREMTALSPEEAARFLAATKEDRLAALYVLALCCGLRQGELLGLRWADIDLEAGTLLVRRSLGWIKGLGWTFSEPKSLKSRRTVALPALAVGSLKKHRVAQAAEKLALGGAWPSEYGDLVFCSRIGTPLTKTNLIRRSFHPILERAGLPRLRFHDLRHSAASLLLDAGESLPAVSDLLGHAKVSTTANVYAHAVRGSQRRVADRMDDLLGGANP